MSMQHAGNVMGGSRWRGCRRGISLLVASVSLAVASASPAATSPSGILSAGTHDIYYRGEVLPDEGMAELRGGFRLAGMDLNFGAKLTTAINERVRYITQVAFDNAGARVLSSTLEQSGSEPVTQVGGPGGVDAASIGGKIDLTGLSDFSGVLMSDGKGGMTAALHNITRDAIVSSLSTTASGQSISNEIDVSVQVMNIGEMRSFRQRGAILNSLQGILPR
ncbi:hypothetical protein CVH10_06220 [Halomonas sp. ND22Bw]|uniref:hypothetical protein n=1 Tax=Halomonas sp. ND22Bw TaxID=2054178 RepID=UPI000D0B01D4|nr:hypothetical protein CVH10_06220 [Halomonas sp. ND22Bw]